MTRQVLRIAVGLVLFGAAIAVIGPSSIGDRLERVGAPTLAVAGLLLLVDTLTRLVRWQLLVQPAAPRPALDHARVYLSSNFLNSFAPGNLSGDAYRVVQLRADAGGAAPVLEAIMRERVFGLLGYLVGYLLAVGVALAVDVDVEPVFMRAAFVVAVAVLAAPLAMRLVGQLAARHGSDASRTRRLLAGVGRALDVQQTPSLVLVAALSLVAWASWVATVAVVADGLGLDLSVPVLAAIATLTELVRFVPITFQGLGVREAAFAFFVAAAGGTGSQGFSLGVVAYLLLSISLVASAPLAWAAGALARRRPRSDVGA